MACYGLPWTLRQARSLPYSRLAYVSRLQAYACMPLFIETTNFKGISYANLWYLNSQSS